MNLTDQQLEIIGAGFREPTLVHAGPGTGKTEVVARKLNHLLKNQRLTPGQILVLSFSRAAVKALIQRINSLHDSGNGIVEDLRHLSVRTFDSWSFRMLRFMGEEPASLLKNGYEENIALLISKLRLSTREQLLGDEALQLSKIRHIIVDECQDLTGLRAKLVQVLLNKLVPADGCKEGSLECGFTILGDPNQAIYGWTLDECRGEDNLTSQELMSWIKVTYLPSLKVRPLDINHRATPELCDLVVEASEILKRSEDKGTDPRSDLLSLISRWTEYEDSEDIVRDIQFSDNVSRLAILCRDNSQIINLQKELRRKLPPAEFSRIMVTAGEPPRLLPSWIAAMLFRFRTGVLGKTTFTKIYNQVAASGHFHVPPSFEAEAAWRMLMKFARQGDDETSISMDNLRTRLNWPDSLPDDEGLEEDSILITTIHQSKGLEFDRVKLLERDNGREDTDVFEEGRVLFVAISRARHELSLLEVPGMEQFYHSSFGRTGRQRWLRRGGYGVTLLEIGQDGDQDLEAIVRNDIQGNEETVREVQEFLTRHERELRGTEVVLKKTPVPNEERRFVYNVTIPDPEGREIILGQTTQVLTKDMVSLMESGQGLPQTITGLTIRGITTVARPSLLSATIPFPWSESRLWLAVDIHGIGQFRFIRY